MNTDGGMKRIKLQQQKEYQSDSEKGNELGRLGKNETRRKKKKEKKKSITESEEE